MAIEIALTSPASPDAVLTAIEALGRQWRRSELPADLGSGVTGLRVRRRGTRFRVQLRRVWGPRGGDTLALTGRVVASAGEPTRVYGRCGYLFGLPWTLGGLGALAAWVWWSGGSGAWIVVGLGLVVAVARSLVDAGATRDTDAEAAYLVRRDEEAVVAASRPAANPPGT